ncbi:dienelactone hydrolase family protein [Paractinoplanes ovalisporus]|uniref:dienelactone hydrolase family protein n=1 Tax=Paractinoplanes ovalisporus TaxID=2810368 RepID=UPI0027DB659D|nr:alpha/beta fold hydrolase [Actinoplanes ovalisporus]
MELARRWLPPLLALLAVVTGGVLLARVDDGIVTDHVVVDGVPLDVMRPASAARAPGVVVAHGYAGSARLMAQFGDTLVARGYTVVLPDLDGHGASTRKPVDLQHDLDVAVAHLRRLPTVDPARIALVGHSMGAGAVTRYAATHPDITATVAISLPGADDVTPNRPAHLLLLVGQLEFASFHETATAVGGAEEVPGVEHISILYASRTHRLTADWIDDAFARTPVDTTLPSPVRRLVPAGILLLGLLLGFVPLVRLTVGAGGRPAPPSAQLVRVVVVTAGAAALAVVVVPFLPTTRWELGGYTAGFTAVAGVAILAYLRAFSSPLGGPRPLLAALLLIPYAAAAIAVPLHLGFTHAVPVGPRWWLLLAVWAGLAVLAYAAGRLAGGTFRGDLIVSAIVVVALTAAAVVGLASGFLLLVVPLLAVLMLIQAALAVVLRAANAPPWLTALTGAILVAWPIATTLPIVSP